ncbi:MAG: glycoside hydrolase family 130 protein [Spirochaetales bacterium]|nr:glycoside hydrolase family 130 protein [Spirochaetales bacterium]
MASLVNSPHIPNLPWEDRPSGKKDVVWRYSENPIIGRNEIRNANSIFNSAVVPFNGKFAGVFRCDDTSRHQNLYCGFSDDGIHWKLDDKAIDFAPLVRDMPPSEYKYDPRVIRIDSRYYIIWCNGYHGACLGAGYTDDFKSFYQLENIFIPYNRNGVLFPRKIHGKYAILTRPSDSGHTPFGDVFYSESPDMVHWGMHRHVMSPADGWQSTKVGAGPVPIETDEGWLLIYHGVLTSCNGFVYSMGAALVDRDQPWKIIARSKPYLLSPQELYECVGDTPNVVFPCAALTDAESGKIAIYYGCADTVTGLAFAFVDEVIDFVRKHNLA